MITYTYDNLGQLLSAAGDQTYTYTYDNAGNIRSANGHTYDYRDADWKDLLTAFDGQEIDYDESGNPRSYYNGTRWNFTWENGRNLATASSASGSLSFEYDSDGLRTKKTVSGGAAHNYFYAGGQLLRETYEDIILDFSYDANGYPYALNEGATLKHDNSSLIEIDTHINGALLTNYMSDGLIISTPTGSTGYSLSVGGPIIVPRSGTFCLSPVASHSLSTRPVIVCDDVVITLRVRSRSHNFLIAVDGRSESISENTTITLRRAPYAIGVMKVMHQNFFDTLRDKMMWGADQRI